MHSLLSVYWEKSVKVEGWSSLVQSLLKESNKHKILTTCTMSASLSFMLQYTATCWSWCFGQLGWRILSSLAFPLTLPKSTYFGSFLNGYQSKSLLEGNYSSSLSRCIAVEQSRSSLIFAKIPDGLAHCCQKMGFLSQAASVFSQNKQCQCFVSPSVIKTFYTWS